MALDDETYRGPGVSILTGLDMSHITLCPAIAVQQDCGRSLQAAHPVRPSPWSTALRRNREVAGEGLSGQTDYPAHPQPRIEGHDRTRIASSQGISGRAQKSGVFTRTAWQGASSNSDGNRQMGRNRRARRHPGSSAEPPLAATWKSCDMVSSA